jgi:hypothetical protein
VATRILVFDFEFFIGILTCFGCLSMDCKMPEFFEKPPLSRAGKHPDFQVTL